MKINIVNGDLSLNYFNKPILSELNTLQCFVNIDKTEKIDTFFIVFRDLLAYKNEQYMFNDWILLVDQYGNVLFQQKCDSTAGLNPVSRWSKRTQDAYTLKPGLYPIELTTYREDRAFHIIKGFTIAGFRVGIDFTARHLIHDIGYFDDIDEQAFNIVSKWVDDKGYRSGSGGCITIPKNRNGKDSILDFNYSLNMNIPTQLLIYEFKGDLNRVLEGGKNNR